MILDTNALSAWADGDAAVEASALVAHQPVVPVVVLGEYLFGIRQSRYRARYEDWLRRTVPMVQIAISDPATAESYATIRLELKAVGRPIPANDLWIAALARQHALPVLSRDSHFDAVRDLERIPF